MILRNIEFGNCFLASGSMNFFGEGYWYDNFYKLLMPGFKIIDQVTFVAKTTTFGPRLGNMPLKENFQPKELFPKCIKVYPSRGVVLNSVGLSGPGAQVLFDTRKWQAITKPFFFVFYGRG
jgi:hypothetical protein